MPIVIEELRAEVLADPATPGAPPAGHGQPTDGPASQDLLDLIDLAREREQRLACD
ncbi:MAG: hypothetical protein RL375_722 [Pseudomonadota bacterium]|jgi:hypothetical protein